MFNQEEEFLFRAVEPEDLDFLFRMENDSRFWKFSQTLLPFSKDYLTRYIYSDMQNELKTSGQMRFIVEDRQNSRPMGIADLFECDLIHRRAGIGLFFDTAYQNRHWGRKILDNLTAYSREVLHLHLIWAEILKSNIPAVRLFQQCEFEICGHKKEWILSPSNQWEDLICFQKIL